MEGLPLPTGDIMVGCRRACVRVSVDRDRLSSSTSLTVKTLMFPVALLCGKTYSLEELVVSTIYQ
jgi:hypothetical protein